MPHKCQTVSKTGSTTKGGYNPRHAYVSANFGGFSHSTLFLARALSLYAKAHIYIYIFLFRNYFKAKHSKGYTRQQRVPPLCGRFDTLL